MPKKGAVEGEDIVVTKDKENEAIQDQFQEREAGVADLFELYSKVEQVYVSSLEAVEQPHALADSSSTNL